MSDDRSRPFGPHWFEAVAEHSAPPTCATRSRRGRGRRSSSWSARSASPRACGSSTSGAARPSRPRAGGARRSPSTASTSANASSNSPGRRSRRSDVRTARAACVAVRRRVRCRRLPVPGRVRPHDRGRARRDRGGRHGAGAAPGWPAGAEAFSAYFVVRHWPATTPRPSSTPRPASTTSEPRSATRPVTAIETDLWTGCYTPRELRLLCAAHGLAVDSISSVEPGAYGLDAPTADTAEYPPARHPGDPAADRSS